MLPAKTLEALYVMCYVPVDYISRYALGVQCTYLLESQTGVESYAVKCQGWANEDVDVAVNQLHPDAWLPGCEVEYVSSIAFVFPFGSNSSIAIKGNDIVFSAKVEIASHVYGGINVIANSGYSIVISFALANH